MKADEEWEKAFASKMEVDENEESQDIDSED